MTIPNTLFYDPRPQFSDTNGNPLDGGTLEFYEAGTITLKNIYADSSLATPLDNPFPLEAGGFVPEGGIWLAEGDYKLIVKNSLGAIEWELDNISGAGSSGGGAGFGYVDSIESMRQITADSTGLVYVSGYYTAGDLGGGFFTWDTTSTATDDGGSVIAPQGTPATGRWLRVFATPQTWPEQWGCRVGPAYSNASAMENMIAYCQGNTSVGIVLTAGDWYLNGNVSFSGDISVTIREGFRGRGISGSHSLTFSCKTLNVESRTELAEQFPAPLLSLVVSSDVPVYPQWWGAVEGTATNSTIYFDACTSQSSDNDIVIDAPFFVESGNFTGQKLVRRDLGRLDLGDLGIIFDDIESKGRFFTGDYSDLTFLNGELQGDWFDFDSGVDATQWSDWIGNIGGKHVKWVEPANIEFTASYSGTPFDISFDVAEGVLFKATGALVVVNFPKVLTRGYCFDNTSTGAFAFGTRLTDATQFYSNFNSLGFAIRCGCQIDFDSKEYSITTGVDVTSLSNTIILKNGRITFTGAFGQTYGLTYDAELRLIDMAVSSTGASGSFDRAFWQQGTGHEFYAYDSRFGGSSSHNIILDDSGANTYAINNCRFGEGLIQITVKGDSFQASGNLFDNTDIYITDPNNVTITNNNFIQNASAHSIFMSAPASYTGSGFVVNNNIVSSPSSDYFVQLNDTSGIGQGVGDNYQIQVEGNIGTKISTTYIGTYTTNESYSPSQNTDFLLLENWFDLTPMRNSGFFLLQSASVTSETINDVIGVGVDSFDSNTVVDIVVNFRFNTSQSVWSELVYVTCKRGF